MMVLTYFILGRTAAGYDPKERYESYRMTVFISVQMVRWVKLIGMKK